MERDPSAESLLREGRQAYTARRFKEAARCFTLAMKRCPCAKGLKRERCQCKNFTRAAESGVSIFQEALNTCDCSVGRTFDNCNSSLHIQALDYRAAAFEALEVLDRARKDAEWMLEIAPRSPDGYLRLGKICRLEKNNRLAWKVFNAGIEAGASAGLEKLDVKMKKLYDARQPLHARYFRQDPLQLPLELVQDIFSYLTLPERLACLCVCKLWRTALTNSHNCHLWRTFQCYRRPPNRVVRKYLSWSGNDVQRMVIKADLDGPEWNQWLEMLMRGARKLSHLDLRFGPKGLPQRLTIEAWPRSLSTMILHSSGVDTPLLPQHLVRLDLGDLRHFHLPGSWPNLRYLYMRSSFAADWMIALFFMPQLEQIRISARKITLKPSADRFLRPEKHLKAVILHSTEKGNFSEARMLHILCSGAADRLAHVDVSLDLESLENLELDRECNWDQHLAMWHNRDQNPGSEIASSTHPTSTNSLANLRSFRLDKMPSHPETARNLLQNSVDNGTLRTFSIYFSRFGAAGRDRQTGDDHCQWLNRYGWLKGAVSIRTLGIRNYFYQYLNSTQEDALPEFLESFPNLEVLDIESGHLTMDETCFLIRRIMPRTKSVKVIHSPGLNPFGPAYDALIAEARTTGVKIVIAPEPTEWPVRLEE